MVGLGRTDMSVRVPLLPRWFRWSAVVAAAALIFYLSILTAPPADPVVPKPELLPLDKWRHFLAYAGLGGTLAYATADWSWSRRALVIAVVGTTILYGIGIEAWQAFIPERYFSLGDAWANAFGGLLVLPWYAVRPHLELTPLREWLGGLRTTT
jgi:VanZ family protein